MKKKNNQKEIKKTKELIELENVLKRVQADFENYKKRSQQEKESFAIYANTDLIIKILPVIDNFYLATKHLPKELENNNWAQGVLQIEKQLTQVLLSEGVEKIEVLGKKFDPYVHEAIEAIDSERPPDEIIEEVQPGYKINEKILRHAKVKIAKNNAKEL